MIDSAVSCAFISYFHFHVLSKETPEYKKKKILDQLLTFSPFERKKMAYISLFIYLLSITKQQEVLKLSIHIYCYLGLLPFHAKLNSLTNALFVNEYKKRRRGGRIFRILLLPRGFDSQAIHFELTERGHPYQEDNIVGVTQTLKNTFEIFF